MPEAQHLQGLVEPSPRRRGIDAGAQLVEEGPIELRRRALGPGLHEGVAQRSAGAPPGAYDEATRPARPRVDDREGLQRRRVEGELDATRAPGEELGLGAPRRDGLVGGGQGGGLSSEPFGQREQQRGGGRGGELGLKGEGLVERTADDQELRRADGASGRERLKLLRCAERVGEGVSEGRHGAGVEVGVARALHRRPGVLRGVEVGEGAQREEGVGEGFERALGHQGGGRGEVDGERVEARREDVELARGERAAFGHLAQGGAAFGEGALEAPGVLHHPRGGGGVEGAGGGLLQAGGELRVEALAIVEDVVHQGHRVAQPDGLRPLRDHVQGRSLLAHHGHALSPGEGLGDEVHDHLALAGAGRSVDHQGALGGRAAQHRPLAGIGVEHRPDRRVVGVDGRLHRGDGLGLEARSHLRREQRGGAAEHRARVRGGVGEGGEQRVVVLEQVAVGLGEEAEHGALLDLQAVAAPEGELVGAVSKGREGARRSSGAEPYLGECLEDGLDAPRRVRRGGVEGLREGVGEGVALLREEQPEERDVDEGRLVLHRREREAPCAPRVPLQRDRVQHQRTAHQVALHHAREEGVTHREVSRSGLLGALPGVAVEPQQGLGEALSSLVRARLGGVDQAGAPAVPELGERALGEAGGEAVEVVQVHAAAGAGAVEAHRGAAPVAGHELVTQGGHRAQQAGALLGEHRGVAAGYPHRRRWSGGRGRTEGALGVLIAGLQRRVDGDARAIELDGERAQHLGRRRRGADQTEHPAKGGLRSASTDDPAQEGPQRLRGLAASWRQRERSCGGLVDGSLDAEGAERRGEQRLEELALSEECAEGTQLGDLGLGDGSVCGDEVHHQQEEGAGGVGAGGAQHRRDLGQPGAGVGGVEVPAPVGDPRSEHPLDGVGLDLRELAVGRGDQHAAGEGALVELGRRRVEQASLEAERRERERSVEEGVDLGEAAGTGASAGERAILRGLAEEPRGPGAHCLLGPSACRVGIAAREQRFHEFAAVEKPGLGVPGEGVAGQRGGRRDLQAQEGSELLAGEEGEAVGGELHRQGEGPSGGRERAGGASVACDEVSHEAGVAVRDPRAVSEVVAQLVAEGGDRRASVEEGQQPPGDLEHDGLFDRVDGGALAVARQVDLHRAFEAQRPAGGVGEGPGVRRHRLGEPYGLGHQPGAQRFGRRGREGLSQPGELREGLHRRGEAQLGRHAEALDVEGRQHGGRGRFGHAGATVTPRASRVQALVAEAASGSWRTSIGAS